MFKECKDVAIKKLKNMTNRIKTNVYIFYYYKFVSLIDIF